MTESNHLGIIRIVFALIFCLPTFADTVEIVSINTSAINGTAGKLAFDFTNNNPGNGNHVQILNFAAPGATLGLPETQGGLVSGDLILGLNPAPFTIIDSDFFFNELIVNFAHFSNSIAFQLDLSQIPPTGGAPPAEFALFMLDASGLPIFPTGDPSGADALFTFDVTGTPSGVLNFYDPTTLAPPNNINVTVPGGAAIPEPSFVLLLAIALAGLAAYRELRGFRLER